MVLAAPVREPDPRTFQAPPTVAESTHGRLFVKCWFSRPRPEGDEYGSTLSSLLRHDVHAKMLVACLIVNGGRDTRTFSTMTDDLLNLLDWLVANECTQVAIESTGVYWRPVFNILEGAVEVMLVNAREAKGLKARKTDVIDAEWLADLLRHGFAPAQFHSTSTHS